MAVYKILKCDDCGYHKNEPEPGKVAPPCPRCTIPARYSDNWYIDYYASGVRKTEAVAPQKTMAVAALAKRKTEIREGRFFDKVKAPTWTAACKDFRKWFETNVAPKTARMYENSLRVLGAHFEGYTLDKITMQMVENFKTDRLAAGKEPKKEGGKVLPITNSTVNRDLATIKRMFSLAEEWGQIEVNKIVKVKLLKENDARLRFLTEKEMDKLLASCNQEWLKIAVLIALETGLRKGSVFDLTWGAVDFPRRQITAKVKGNKIVRVPLTNRLHDELKAYKERQKIMSQWVIPAPNDPAKQVPVDHHATFDRTCTRAGLHDFRFHDLRHTFASHFLMRTGDIRTLQEILGHADIKMTMKYSHVLDEHKHKAMGEYEKGRNSQSTISPPS